MSKIKNGVLNQYGAKPFKQVQFGTAGIEWVKKVRFSSTYVMYMLVVMTFGVIL